MIKLVMLNNFAVMMGCFYVAFSPKFRPMPWRMFDSLIFFAGVNAVCVVGLGMVFL